MQIGEHCPVCDASVGPTKSDVIDHLKNEHDLTENEINVVYNFQGKFCVSCGEEYDMSYNEYIEHLKEEHGIVEEDIHINVSEEEEQLDEIQGQTTIVDVIERNVRETKEFLEDWRDEHYNQRKRRLWIRGALVGGVIIGIMALSYSQILSGDTITSLVSVIVGYLLAEQQL
jgi:DNA-directed RNA polymerase subunit N (RpoN/RPB10)